MGKIDTLTYDLETIPQREPLSQIQQEELEKKLNRYMEKHPKAKVEDARSLLMGTSPYFGEIVCIGLHRHKPSGEEGSTCLVGEEKEILEKFWDNVNGFYGTFVSFNGHSFDQPFLLKRSMKHGVKPTSKRFLDGYRYQTDPHFDVQEIISNYNRWDAPTLRLACDLLGVSSPKEGEIKAENVAQAFKDGRIDEIADYCERDVKSTFQCYMKLQDYYKGK